MRTKERGGLEGDKEEVIRGLKGREVEERKRERERKSLEERKKGEVKIDR